MRIVFLFYIFSLYVLGGTGTLVDVSDGETIQTKHVNQYVEALLGDIVPRNSSGKAESEAGSLGSTAYRWGRSYVTSGGYRAGSIVYHHSFGGSIKCQQGWMRANGSIINKENYDAYHSAGDWNRYIGSSILEGKYLPDSSNKEMFVGAAKTTQDGSKALTRVGDASAGTEGKISFAHTHTTWNHSHEVYQPTTLISHAKVFDKTGTAVDVVSKSFTPATLQAMEISGLTEQAQQFWSSLPMADGGSFQDNTGAANWDSGLDGIATIPVSIEFEICVRIID